MSLPAFTLKVHKSRSADPLPSASAKYSHPLLTRLERRENAELAEKEAADTAAADTAAADSSGDSSQKNQDPLTLMDDDDNDLVEEDKTTTISGLDGMDPLSMMMMGGDPLSANAPPAPPTRSHASSTSAGAESGAPPPTPRKQTEALDMQQAATEKFNDELAIPWATRKEQILRDYKVTSVRVTANFMREENNREEARENRSVDRTKARLKQLERGGEEDAVELTQKEYVDRITKLHGDMQTAWKNGERVLTIKIVVKMAKLLGDVSSPKFYPSVFICVTEIMDTFGDLVYNRILGKAKVADDGKKIKLKPNWTAEDINTTAKETCRNWFYKTSCTVDLLPRLYIEIALLRCYKFLSTDEYSSVLGRLASMIRGIGDPIVAVYAQCYLARCGSAVAPKAKVYANTMLHDYLFTFQSYEEKLNDQIEAMGITMDEFLHLQSPAVEWTMRCLANGAPKTTFTNVLKHYRDFCGNSMVLKHVIDCFEPKHYAPNAAAMVTLVKQAKPSKITTVDIFKTMATRFIQAPPPEEQRMVILNDVWRIVTKCGELKEYLGCANAWLEFVLVHYSDREVKVLLKDICKHLNSVEADVVEDSARELEPLVALLVQHCYDYDGVILTSGELLQIFDKFKENKKAELSKELIEEFLKHTTTTSDPVLINTLFEMSRTVHDSLDSLSTDGERRHVANLISGFIRKISFGNDFEAQLNQYVECRAAFHNLDDISRTLCLCILELCMQTHKVVKGRHSKKTVAFVKASLAFCHISIPSIDSVFDRLHLLLQCAIVSLQNQCLPQTDTFLKSAISLIPEVPLTEVCEYRNVNTEPRLASLLCSFVGLLIVVPGSPEHGPFYLVQGFLNAVPRYKWSETSGAQIGVYIEMLGMLSAFKQPSLPYHVEFVDSNDTLYGGSKEYHEELDEVTASVMKLIVDNLTRLGESEGKNVKSKQSEMSLLLVNKMITVLEMDEVSFKFAKNLLKLVDKAANAKELTVSIMKQYNDTKSLLAKYIPNQ